MSRGVVIIGYQGIGKSTLSNEKNHFIDLESSNFWINGERSDDWYKPYCKIAVDLASQHFVVFTSSHEPVRQYIKTLQHTDVPIIYMVPSLKLKDVWVDKLHERYSRTSLNKDYKAYMNAKDRYTENIREIQADIIHGHVIEDIDYNLEEEITSAFKNLNISFTAKTYL